MRGLLWSLKKNNIIHIKKCNQCVPAVHYNRGMLPSIMNKLGGEMLGDVSKVPVTQFSLQKMFKETHIYRYIMEKT